MSNETLFQLLFDVVLMLIGCEALLHEKQLARFERKVWKYIRCFFKALWLSFKEFLGKGQN